MTDGEPTDEQRSRRFGRVVRPVLAVTTKVDQAAGQVERLSGDLVERASARIEHRRGGSYAVLVLRQFRAGLLFMVRDWRLMLLQVPAAFTIALVLYRLRVVAVGVAEIVRLSVGSLVAWLLVGVLLTLLVYGCGTVFNIAMVSATPDDPVPLGKAWRETRRRWPLVVVCAAFTAILVIGLFLLARLGGRLWYATIGLVAVVLLISLIAVVPMRISASQPRKQREQTRAKATALAIQSGAKLILELPTIGMGEIGRLLTQVPGLRLFGYVAAVIGGLLHMAASSSARALKVTAKLKGQPTPVTGPTSLDGGHPVAGPAHEELDDQEQDRRHDDGDDHAAPGDASPDQEQQADADRHDPGAVRVANHERGDRPSETTGTSG